MRALVGCVVLLSLTVAVASADVGVRLTEAPATVRLPLAGGVNAILTARVDGEVRAVWLATAREAKARYLLDRVGEGVYQVNLADPVLSAMLEAADAGQVHVFAEAPDGTVAQSVGVRYAVRAAPQRWVRPPRVFIHTAEKVTDVTEWLNAMDGRTFAMFARLHGQGVEFTVPDVSMWGRRATAEGVTAWLDPSEVKALEVQFDPNAEKASARATVAEQEWPCVAASDDGHTLRLDVTDAIRKAWAADERLVITCKQQGMHTLRVVIGAPARKLDLPDGEAKLTVMQRNTEFVPGSGGYLWLHIGDITGGQTLLTLATADGRELIKRRSIAEGATNRFKLGGKEYDLTMTNLVNLLLGEDYAEFVVKPHVKADEEP